MQYINAPPDTKSFLSWVFTITIN